MKKHSILRLGLLGVLLAAGLTAEADVYRWVDAQGGIHYSDMPASDNAERVSILSRRTDASAVSQRDQTAREQRARTDTQAQQQQANQAAAKAVKEDLSKTRAERCQKAQEDYQKLIDSMRIYRTGKDGEREYLTDAEITEARVNAKKAVDENCKEK
jgi:hypothetical protein